MADVKAETLSTNLLRQRWCNCSKSYLNIRKRVLHLNEHISFQWHWTSWSIFICSFCVVYDEVPLQNYVGEKRPIKEIGGRLGMTSPLHVNYADLPLLKSMSQGERWLNGERLAQIIKYNKRWRKAIESSKKNQRM